MVEFMFNHWSKCDHVILQDVPLIMVHGQQCHSLHAEYGSTLVNRVDELCCNHEEADTCQTHTKRLMQQSLLIIS